MDFNETFNRKGLEPGTVVITRTAVNALLEPFSEQVHVMHTNGLKVQLCSPSLKMCKISEDLFYDLSRSWWMSVKILNWSDPWRSCRILNIFDDLSSPCKDPERVLRIVQGIVQDPSSQQSLQGFLLWIFVGRRRIFVGTLEGSLQESVESYVL